MSTAVQPLIDIRGLTHTYLLGTPMEAQSLHGVDLQVYPGETVGIVGPTGSGKSTLLQHMNGLLRPQQGQVFVNGISLADPDIDIRAVRQRIGLVFQNPEDQLFERYAGDDVAYGPRNLELPPDQVRERVRQAMEMVGLPFAYKDRLITELSQGERRRLVLAGVLAMEPQVLVLDEPTAGLDPQGRRELLRILIQWRARPERAIVLASHNMEDIAELVTRVYVLVEGRIVLHGTPQEVFAEHELLTQWGLSIPVATGIMLQLHRYGFPVSTNVLGIDEAVREIEELLYAHSG